VKNKEYRNDISDLQAQIEVLIQIQSNGGDDDDPSFSSSSSELLSSRMFLRPEKSLAPTINPSAGPSDGPSAGPTSTHSLMPSDVPSVYPSNMPSLEPSMQPTTMPCPVNFTLDILTDKYPVETSWTLTNIFLNTVIGEGSSYQNDFEMHEESVCLWYDNCYSTYLKFVTNGTMGYVAAMVKVVLQDF